MNKTVATKAEVGAYLAAIASDERRADCERLVALMRKVTGEAPVMWGPSIVGFGRYHYRYESGREGDMCLIGFAARKGDISVYTNACGLAQHQADLELLGKHKAGVSCLYVKRLADIDLAVLERMLRRSIAGIQKRYPT